MTNTEADVESICAVAVSASQKVSAATERNRSSRGRPSCFEIPLRGREGRQRASASGDPVCDLRPGDRPALLAVQRAEAHGGQPDGRRPSPADQPDLPRRAALDSRKHDRQLHRLRSPGHGPRGHAGYRRGREERPDWHGSQTGCARGPAPAADLRDRHGRRDVQHGQRRGLRPARAPGRDHLHVGGAPPDRRAGGGIRRRLGGLQRQPDAGHDRPAPGRNQPGGGAHHRPGLQHHSGLQLLLHGGVDLPHRRSRHLGHREDRRPASRRV